MLTKYAKSESFIEIKTASTRLPYSGDDAIGDGFNKFAALKDEGVDNGYLYIRCRAISSRVNKNNDGWPSEELAKAYKSFIGRPIFVDHNNDNPKRTRGVIIDSRLHVDDEEKTSALDPYYSSAPDNHKPPTWIELLLEVDGRTYPKLATAIRKGYIDSTSMGANIEYSICNICANEAKNPQEYCSHVSKKGAEFEVTSADGQKTHKKAYEDCYDINFFEDSFVFDPADPTALITEKKGKTADVAPYNYEEEGDYGDTPTSQVSETQQVFEWRLDQLLKVGLPPEVAQPVAENLQIDLHQALTIAEQVKQQGGNPELVYQILSKKSSEEDFPGIPNENADEYEQEIADQENGEFEDEPSEGDYVLVEGHSGVEVYQIDYPKGHLGAFRDWEDAALGIKEAMAKEGFYPNVWFQSDHGNMHLLNLGEMLPGTSPQDQPGDTYAPDFSQMGPAPQGGDYERESAWKRTPVDDSCNNCGSKNTKKILHEAFDDDNLYSCGDCSKNFRAKRQSNFSFLDYIRVQKTALDDPFKENLPGQPTTEYDRQLNHEPQSEMTKAPAEVDTLRKEFPCPNCKSDHLTSDPDGIMRCPTCNWAQPPHPLDNPDLNIHQNLDMAQEGQEQQSVDSLLDQIQIKPKGQGQPPQQQQMNAPQGIPPVNPINSSTSKEGINRMNWTTVSNQASVETLVGNPAGISAETYKVLQDNGLTAKITYPTGETSQIPFGNHIKDAVLGLRAQRIAGLQSVAEVPITVETDLKDIETVLSIIHTGALPQKKKILNPSTKSKTEDPQNAKIISDQSAPVTSGEKEADRRKIKRQEEDVNTGISRSEEIIEESGDSVSDYSAPTQEEKEETDDREPAYASERQLLAAFSLADQMIEAGYLTSQNKLAFVGKLAKEPVEKIEARRETFEMMRSTKVAKRETPTLRVPRFSSFQAESNTDSTDDISFDAIFMS